MQRSSTHLLRSWTNLLSWNCQKSSSTLASFVDASSIGTVDIMMTQILLERQNAKVAMLAGPKKGNVRDRSKLGKVQGDGLETKTEQSTTSSDSSSEGEE